MTVRPLWKIRMLRGMGATQIFWRDVEIAVVEFVNHERILWYIRCRVMIFAGGSLGRALFVVRKAEGLRIYGNLLRAGDGAGAMG